MAVERKVEEGTVGNSQLIVHSETSYIGQLVILFEFRPYMRVAAPSLLEPKCSTINLRFRCREGLSPHIHPCFILSPFGRRKSSSESFQHSASVCTGYYELPRNHRRNDMWMYVSFPFRLLSRVDPSNVYSHCWTGLSRLSERQRHDSRFHTAAWIAFKTIAR